MINSNLPTYFQYVWVLVWLSGVDV
jgi:hypothetical protein